jgi:hypothetical protein
MCEHRAESSAWCRRVRGKEVRARPMHRAGAPRGARGAPAPAARDNEAAAARRGLPPYGHPSRSSARPRLSPFFALARPCPPRRSILRRLALAPPRRTTSASRRATTPTPLGTRSPLARTRSAAARPPRPPSRGDARLHAPRTRIAALRRQLARAAARMQRRSASEQTQTMAARASSAVAAWRCHRRSPGSCRC